MKHLPNLRNLPVFFKETSLENDKKYYTFRYLSYSPSEPMSNLENFATDHLLLAFFSSPAPADLSALVIDDEDMPEVNQELVHHSLSANITNLGQEKHME